MAKVYLSEFILYFCFFVNSGNNWKYTDRFIFKMHKEDVEFVKKALGQDYMFVNEIMPDIYVFRHLNVSGGLPEAKLLQILDSSKGKIEKIEQVKEVFVNLMQTVTESLQALTMSTKTQFGMGIEEAWAENRNGEGVTIAILDVGVKIEHEFLSDNIDRDRSRNFVAASVDVKPDYQRDYNEYMSYADHGTNTCGLIAASSANSDECSKGVAYKAKVAVFKIATVDALMGCKPCMAMDHFAAGLSFMQDHISIFTNGFAYEEQFQESDFASYDAIEQGSIYGRHGRGSLYVFPSGELGNGLANNPYTVVVSSVGHNGSIPSFVTNSAAVLTAALSEGSSLNSTTLMTTSGIPDKRCARFGGSSASTAIVSAIAAQVLQTNPHLTRRDVMHILVRSSEHESLKHESPNFHRNGAGYLYHCVFGFGLLNAKKASTLAASWEPVEPLVVVQKTSPSDFSCNMHKCTINITCVPGSACVKKIEQVRVLVTVGVSEPNNTRLLLVSPSGTRSVLVDAGQVQPVTVTKDVWMRSVNFWGEHGTGVWAIELEFPDGEVPHLKVLGFTFYGTGTTSDSIPQIKRSAVGATIAMLYPLAVFAGAAVFVFFYKKST